MRCIPFRSSHTEEAPASARGRANPAGSGRRYNRSPPRAPAATMAPARVASRDRPPSPTRAPRGRHDTATHRPHPQPLARRRRRGGFDIVGVRRRGGAQQLIHTYTGAGSADYFGRAVAIVGDVNGDGFDDVLIGAPDEEPTPAAPRRRGRRASSPERMARCSSRSRAPASRSSSATPVCAAGRRERRRRARPRRHRLQR